MKYLGKLAAACATAACLAIPQVALADALGVAIVQLDDFVLGLDGSTLDAGAGGDIVITSFTTTASSSVTIDGVGPSTDSEAFPGDPLPLDTYNCTGACDAMFDAGVYTDNDFTMLSSSEATIPGSTFALADTLEGGSPVIGAIDPGTGMVIPTGADIYNAAYASSVNGSQAFGAATQTVSADWVFTAGVAGELTIDFDATTYLEAYVENGQLENSDASYSVSFTLSCVPVPGATPCDADQSVTWVPGTTPPGATTLNADGTVPVLTDDVATSNFVTEIHCGAGGDVCTALGGQGTIGAFSTVSYGLSSGFTIAAGQVYQLSASTTVVVNAKSIPEPGSMVLLGSGLTLLGLAGRRRRKQR
jgi:hypothetical protein